MIDPPEENGQLGTMGSTAYARLREEILGGQVPPGKKLLIRPLADRYGMGLSPIREALNRLAAEGLLLQSDQRGFTVAPLDPQDLTDLTEARCMVNEMALRASIARGDTAWEEAIVLWHHRLMRTPRYIDSARGLRNPAWERAHRAFHSALISACGSRRIQLYAEQLFDASSRYRSIARSVSMHRRPDESEHKKIAEATLARDVERAAALLTAHFRTTDSLVRKALVRADG
ncbi:MAG TPA: GntR family transcriptional regulator [Polyangiaceae bacterium]|nr:GntR family transcriptional regulator [Polyangiaceae bacterium]